MPIQLVATDIDGTFIDHHSRYDRAWFARLYQRMQAHHIRFVIASGNQRAHLEEFFPETPDILYVAENGAYVADANQTYALSHYQDDDVRALLDYLTAIPELHMSVCTADAAYIRTSEPAANKQMTRAFCPDTREVTSLQAHAHNVVKLALQCAPEQTTPLVTQIKTRFGAIAHPTSSGRGSIDIIQPGLDKAYGLNILSQQLAIPLQNMVAFGDGGNDVTMLEAVGCGVAMANAPEAIKAHADDLTTSCDEQGVLAWLDQHLPQ
ncbi:MAG: Cof-type HAD-IIB family hydrolase [Lactobacillus sp.]|jgi:Cof subfamily protein (haloacid dehalogenase superfamily)|nr:Cof-type HAD-IIB family hydrolase [Lactobacillus sp.]MCI2033597.1 Cof-type HAD-IIB family hydrolase [Lactobacillus sp.]